MTRFNGNLTRGPPFPTKSVLITWWCHTTYCTIIWLISCSRKWQMNNCCGDQGPRRLYLLCTIQKYFSFYSLICLDRVWQEQIRRKSNIFNKTRQHTHDSWLILPVDPTSKPPYNRFLAQRPVWWILAFCAKPFARGRWCSVIKGLGVLGVLVWRPTPWYERSSCWDETRRKVFDQSIHGPSKVKTFRQTIEAVSMLMKVWAKGM